MITEHSEFQRGQEVMVHPEVGRSFRCSIVNAKLDRFSYNDYQWIYLVHHGPDGQPKWVWARNITAVSPLRLLAEAAE